MNNENKIISIIHDEEYTKRQLKLIIDRFDFKLKTELSDEEYEKFFLSVTQQLETDLHIRSQKKTLQKVKKNLERMIKNNLNTFEESEKVLLLTFDQNPKDIRIANNEVKKFIKRLRYYLKSNSMKYDFNYICIPQFERNNITYYIVLFDIPYVSTNIVKDIWSNGIIVIKKLDNSSIEQFIDFLIGDEELVKKNISKRYFYSRGFKRA